VSKRRARSETSRAPARHPKRSGRATRITIIITARAMITDTIIITTMGIRRRKR
jgi:hypothetical protein